jgi:hypothetical protein
VQIRCHKCVCIKYTNVLLGYSIFKAQLKQHKKNLVDVELHPHGVAHIFWKNILNLFVYIKLFSYNFSFFIWFIPFVDIIGTKLAPGDHESNFKKVGAIPCGCNSVWVQYQVNLKIYFFSSDLSFSMVMFPSELAIFIAVSASKTI